MAGRGFKDGCRKLMVISPSGELGGEVCDPRVTLGYSTGDSHAPRRHLETHLMFLFREKSLGWLGMRGLLY